jgi:hypothetical protein
MRGAAGSPLTPLLGRLVAWTLAVVLIGCVGTAGAATLSLSPTSGPTGTSVSATGSGFPKRVQTTIRMGGTVVVSPFRPNSRGRFTRSFVVPPGFSGPTRVTARTTTGVSASANFDVTAPPPPPDRDGDGVPDSTDQCPDVPGAAPSGCPTPPPSTSCAAPPCLDWIGATFSGQNDNHVPNAAHDLAVSGDGFATTGAPWVESSHDQRVYRQDGSPTGSCPWNEFGRFRENGGGPRGVEINGTHVFAVQGRNLVRWDRSTWLTINRCDGGSPRGLTLPLGGSGHLLGVSVTGGEAYVTDAEQDVANTSPATAKIKVYDANLTGGVRRQWTVPRARQTTVDRQGNIWVLQQRTATASARLARYSPSGSLLTAFDVGGEPMDIAASPVADEVLIPDNGQDQRVEVYSYAGAQVRTIGQSYLSGASPGAIGPRRFAGPRGVDVDASGNVYVTQTCDPGRGARGWADDGFCMILSKHQPDGTQLWRVEGDMLADVGEPVTGGSRVYTPGLIFDRSGGDWSLQAVTVDPWTYPSDPRWSDQNLGFQSAATAQVRDIGGVRLMLTARDGGDVRVFRIEGDIAAPVATIGNPGNSQDVSLASNGDVYQARGDQGVSRYRLIGVAPVAYGARQDLGFPPGFVDVRRIEVEGQNVVVAGYGSGEFEPGFDDWKFSGRRVARFGSLPSPWPAAAWSRLVFWGTYPNRPVGIAVDRNRLATAYLSNGTDGYVRVLSMADGSLVQQITWPISIRTGWYDMFRPLAFVDGVVYAEEDEIGKINTADLGP